MKSYIALPIVFLFYVSIKTSSIRAINVIEQNSSSTVMNKKWSVVYNTGLNTYNMTMGEVQQLDITIKDINPNWLENYEFHIFSENSDLLIVEHVVKSDEIGAGISRWTGNISLHAIFLGEALVRVEQRQSNREPEYADETLKVIITRSEGLMDDIYKICVGVLVFILYINFGAILDLYALKGIIIRPIGPAIGFVGQFVCMPILSFLIGYYVFHDMIALRIGLLFTGCTPGGGFSNIFTVVLNGNINLSVTMTTFSNFAAFAMMPLWIFTLGSSILEDGTFVIPYQTIATMSFSLLVPLSLGIALQKYATRWTERICKHMQPISFALIIFVLGFSFTINSYMFSMLSWTIIIACSALPWIGYLLGYFLAIMFKQSQADALTIAIETGIQNTGIAIFMLSFTLPQPQADITSAIPVTNFLLTPVPLIILYIVRRLCCNSTNADLTEEESSGKEIAEYELPMIENGGKLK